MAKLIIHADPEHFILAVRAATQLRGIGSAGFVFEDTVAFYVSRNKNGTLIARQTNPVPQ